MKKFNIQLENLTQFLPQDRVSQFASLGPVDLLKQTEDAVLEPRILELHKELTTMKNDYHTRHVKVEELRKQINVISEKNRALEQDVQRFQRRKKHEERVEQLQLKQPFVVFTQMQHEGRKVCFFV
jgi:chromosome segregation ATPase